MCCPATPCHAARPTCAGAVPTECTMRLRLFGASLTLQAMKGPCNFSDSQPELADIQRHDRMRNVQLPYPNTGLVNAGQFSAARCTPPCLCIRRHVTITPTYQANSVIAECAARQLMQLCTHSVRKHRGQPPPERHSAPNRGSSRTWVGQWCPHSPPAPQQSSPGPGTPGSCSQQPVSMHLLALLVVPLLNRLGRIGRNKAVSAEQQCAHATRCCSCYGPTWPC